MSVDRNRIATELTAEELQDFLAECTKTKGLTLKKVQELAATRGIEVGLMSAKSFRDTTYSRHLQRISKAGELAVQVAALKQAGAGHTIADAAAAVLSDQVLDAIVNGEEDMDLDAMSKIVSRLRAGDVQVAALTHKIEQDKDAVAAKVLGNPKLLAEVAKIKKDDGLSQAQKVAKVRRKLWGDAPKDFTPHTATGAQR